MCYLINEAVIMDETCPWAAGEHDLRGVLLNEVKKLKLLVKIFFTWHHLKFCVSSIIFTSEAF